MATASVPDAAREGVKVSCAKLSRADLDTWIEQQTAARRDGDADE